VQVEDVIATLARRAPRRGEMTLALLKRILRAAESRGQVIDHGVYCVRVASPEDRERAMDSGFEAHLAKPVDPTELVEAVARTARAGA